MIRMAKKSDGSQVLPIVNQIFEEMELKTMAALPQDTLFKELAAAYLTEDYRYSYRRTLVATDDQDKVVGVAVGYPESDEAHVDDALQTLWPKVGLPKDYRLFTDKEARPGEWYLDSLAVAPEAQHRGIATSLLRALPAHVLKTTGLHRISLNVDLTNPGAERLYTKNGYRSIGEQMIGDHKYHHMVRDI
ncbi:GNAT family N-acetyltransferase [Schleiferilactobacillus shenzhenensis]|nr:GNAT family N-acetyltransferase [Schleiferilactobacillus shenzhenensis]